MLANNNGAMWLLYSPTETSFAVTKADVIRNQAAYQVDLMTFNKQTVVCPFSDIQAAVQTGSDLITLNNHLPMSTSYPQYMKGQLSIVSDNTGINPNTVNLFSVIVRFEIELFYRE
jgi:hypothetical protein